MASDSPVFAYCGLGARLNARAALCSEKQTVWGVGVRVGDNATVLAGVKLGDYCLVAPGAVVEDDVPPNGFVKGNPAQLVGFVCKCGKVLPEFPCNWVNDLLSGEQQIVALGPGMSVQCRECGERYDVDDLLKGASNHDSDTV